MNRQQVIDIIHGLPDQTKEAIAYFIASQSTATTWVHDGGDSSEIDDVNGTLCELVHHILNDKHYTVITQLILAAQQERNIT